MAAMLRQGRQKPSRTTEQEKPLTGADPALAKGTGDGGLAKEAAEKEPKLPEAADPAVAKGSAENEVTGVKEPKLPEAVDPAAVKGSGIEKEFAKLAPYIPVDDSGSQYNSVDGSTYCPEPGKDELPWGYKIVICPKQTFPAMQKIKKEFNVNKIDYQDSTINVPKITVGTEKTTHTDQIIVVRKVPKTRAKTFYRVVEEVREVTEMEDVVEYINVPRIEEAPLYKIEYETKKVTQPVVKPVCEDRTMRVKVKGCSDRPCENTLVSIDDFGWDDDCKPGATIARPRRSAPEALITSDGPKSDDDFDSDSKAAATRAPGALDEPYSDDDDSKAPAVPVVVE